MLLLEISLNRKVKFKGVSHSPVMDGETEAQREHDTCPGFCSSGGAGSSDSPWDSSPGLLSPVGPKEEKMNPVSRESRMIEPSYGLETEIRGLCGKK